MQMRFGNGGQVTRVSRVPFRFARQAAGTLVEYVFLQLAETRQNRGDLVESDFTVISRCANAF